MPSARKIVEEARSKYTSSGVAPSIGLVDVASLIRGYLRDRWPDVRFSVRSERYAGWLRCNKGCLPSHLSSIDEIVTPRRRRGLHARAASASTRTSGSGTCPIR